MKWTFEASVLQILREPVLGLLPIVTRLLRGRSRALWIPLLQSIALYRNPPVDILQTDDVVLVELAKGHFKDPYRSVASGRKAVHCRTGDENLLSYLRPDDLVP
jgi:hypothetical protein